MTPYRERLWIPILSMTSIAALIALLLFGSGRALAMTDAEKYGTVAIIDAEAGEEVIVDGEPHVCQFSFDFDLGIEAKVVGWKVKVWNAAPLDGETVLKDQAGPTDADGRLHVPGSGTLTVPDGRYNVVWDDEYPPDGSNGSRSFVVDCADAPAASPTGSELPIGGTQPTPGGQDLGIGGVTTADLTPPPTDTQPGGVATSNSGLIAVAISLLVATTVIFTASWQRLSRRTIRR